MKFEHIVRATKEVCFTWTEDIVLDYLCELASTAKVIVESGTYMGASAYAMLCAAPPDCHMWCVDRFMVAGTEHVTRRNLSHWMRREQCEIMVGDSETARQLLDFMIGKVDICWVDDGHAEEDVMRDIRCLRPLLRPGGVMVGHDFEVPHNDVARGVIRSGIKYTVPIPRLWRYDQP